MKDEIDLDNEYQKRKELFNVFYEEINIYLQQIKDDDMFYENEEKIICTIASKIIGKYIKQKELGRKIDNNQTNYLSNVLKESSKFTDIEYCFSLMEVLKRFGFEVADEGSENANLWYIGFEDKYYINKDYYICIVKIDGNWYGLNRNGLIAETDKIRFNYELSNRIIPDQDKISFLCTKIGEEDDIVKNEGIDPDILSEIKHRMKLISKKEKKDLDNLTNIKKLQKSQHKSENGDSEERRILSKREEKREKKLTERKLKKAKDTKRQNNRFIKRYNSIIEYINKKNKRIREIQEKIDRLEMKKSARIYLTDDIDLQIQEWQDYKKELQEQLPQQTKDFYEREIARLEQINHEQDIIIEENQGEVDNWSKEKIDNRKAFKEGIKSRISTRISLIQNSLRKEEQREDIPR